jgi:hypothetical protein
MALLTITILTVLQWLPEKIIRHHKFLVIQVPWKKALGNLGAPSNTTLLPAQARGPRSLVLYIPGG